MRGMHGMHDMNDMRGIQSMRWSFWVCHGMNLVCKRGVVKYGHFPLRGMHGMHDMNDMRGIQSMHWLFWVCHGMTLVCKRGVVKYGHFPLKANLSCVVCGNRGLPWYLSSFLSFFLSFFLSIFLSFFFFCFLFSFRETRFSRMLGRRGMHGVHGVNGMRGIQSMHWWFWVCYGMKSVCKIGIVHTHTVSLMMVHKIYMPGYALYKMALQKCREFTTDCIGYAKYAEFEPPPSPVRQTINHHATLEVHFKFPVII